MENVSLTEDELKAAEDRKRTLGLIGGIGDALNSAPSFGEIWLGQRNERPSVTEALKPQMQDAEGEITRKRALLDEYRKKKEAQSQMAEVAKGIGALNPRLQSAVQGMSPEVFKESVPLLGKYLDSQADMEKARLAANIKEPSKAIEFETKLRNEWESLPAVKNTQILSESVHKMRKAAANPSAAGDMSLIYAYMKAVDPGSTVREGEFANAENAGGVDDRIRVLYNRATKGQRLDEAQRKDFMNQAEKMYAAQIETLAPWNEKYQALATRVGADPKYVMHKFADPDLQEKLTKQQMADAARAELAKRRGTAKR